MNTKNWILIVSVFLVIMIITNLFYGNVIEANGRRRGCGKKYRRAQGGCGCVRQVNPLYMRQGYHHCNCPFWRRV
jgi:hypothetical protein